MPAGARGRQRAATGLGERLPRHAHVRVGPRRRPALGAAIFERVFDDVAEERRSPALGVPVIVTEVGKVHSVPFVLGIGRGHSASMGTWYARGGRHWDWDWGDRRRGRRARAAVRFGASFAARHLPAPILWTLQAAFI